MFPTLVYSPGVTREEFDLMYAPQGNETVAWSDLRLSKVVLGHNSQVMTELQLEFSNSYSLLGQSPESIVAAQKKQIGFVSMKVRENSAFTGIRLYDQQGVSVIDLEIPGSEGVWSEREAIPTGHKIIGSKVSLSQDILQDIRILTGPIP